MTTELSVGYFNGQWQSIDSFRLSVNDIGFRSGVVAVERLRTYSGHVFQPTLHLQRFAHTTAELMISGLPSPPHLAELIDELLCRNSEQAMVDVGITLFATPGEIGAGAPTIGLHINAIDHARTQRFRSSGQVIATTDVVQPSQTSWSRQLKTRCRLHYYLADAAARRLDAEAVGILLDADGCVTETNIANIAIVLDGNIVSPPANQVLGGITQRVVEQLALDGLTHEISSRKSSISWVKRPISITEFHAADEILMMGTDNGIWFARQVDQTIIGGGNPGPVYMRLRELFDRATRDQRQHTSHEKFEGGNP